MSEVFHFAGGPFNDILTAGDPVSVTPQPRPAGSDFEIEPASVSQLYGLLACTAVADFRVGQWHRCGYGDIDTRIDTRNLTGWQQTMTADIGY